MTERWPPASDRARRAEQNQERKQFAINNIEADAERATIAQRKLPPVIRIEPASVCNLRCTHCPTGVVKMARTIMSPVLFDRVLSEISKHIPPIRVAVLYHGGEPFLNKRFLDMARRVKDLGVERVKTVSNGMLIRPDMCELVVRCGLDEIEISLDGESASENDRVRKRSNFERVAQTVRRIVDANIRQGRPLRVSVATTQFKRNLDQTGEQPRVPEYLRVAFEGIEGEVEFKPTWAMLWPSGEPSSRYDLILEDAPKKPPTSCNLLNETITIRADGQVVACCYDLTSMSNLGNISNTSIEELWNGPIYSKFRADFAAARYPPLCQKCVVVTGDRFLIPRPQLENELPRSLVKVDANEGSCLQQD